MPHRILVIDEDPQVLAFISEFLKRQLGYNVKSAENGEEGLKLALAEKFDLCLIDVKLPDISGSEVYMRLRNEYPDIEAIFITGLHDYELSQEFLRFSLPSERVIKKPFDDLPALTRLIVGILPPPEPISPPWGRSSGLDLVPHLAIE